MGTTPDYILSVIIVNYNVKYFLEQALLSVRKAIANLPVEVFVVDNNSVDDSVQMVQEKFPEFILIANKENVGFSIANNQAMRLAKGKYVLLLNPDTIVEEDTFEKCVQFMENHPKAGALGVKMIDGSGKFLPESKRGFPSPFVAFSKTFGLSRIFPKSKLFNRYHLGYLDKEQTHEIDILSGAFMFMRKKALDEVGLLDESFFMYGEDIDLSYRIQLGGYKNYYYPDTTIIHYKGESTKKGSLNYVKVFYNAMIIFAKKHIKGEKAWLFVAMLRAAIYFRATLTLVNNFFRNSYLILIEGLLIFLGLLWIKDFWAVYHFNDANYYDESFQYFNAPLYTGIWLAALYLSGSYHKWGELRRLFRGVLLGTLFIAAVYGFLDMQYRSSRAIIVLGAIWTFAITVLNRLVVHFIKYKNLRLGRDTANNLIIVGSQSESERVLKVLHQAQIYLNFIGLVDTQQSNRPDVFLSSIEKLEEIVNIYKVDEIIFCSKDISSQQIMYWMNKLGPSIDYKIVPEESWSIIGSSSKNTSGQLYTIDIQFNINDPFRRSTKRWLDILLSLFLLITLPIHFLHYKKINVFLKNIFGVFLGKKSWVGYHLPSGKAPFNLPKIKTGIVSPVQIFNNYQEFDQPTIDRLNLLYAKDYVWSKDLEVMWKTYSQLSGINFPQPL